MLAPGCVKLDACIRNTDCDVGFERTDGGQCVRDPRSRRRRR